jgi:hypothetical protein
MPQKSNFVSPPAKPGVYLGEITTLPILYAFILAHPTDFLIFLITTSEVTQGTQARPLRLPHHFSRKTMVRTQIRLSEDTINLSTK